MTLSVLEGHSRIECLFKCNILYCWRIARSLCICGAYCVIYVHQKLLNLVDAVYQTKYKVSLNLANPVSNNIMNL